MGQTRTETATLAGGCFWCLEAVYLGVAGVQSVESGYTGGEDPSPTYERVCAGITGHAEAVRVHFDPDRVSYRQLLEVFFVIHDPTTPDRQGNDVGTQYRSAIYVHDAGQERTARELVAELGRAGAFDGPIVTEIEAAGPFHPAEDYHRDYFARNPGQGYCRVVISPKVAKFRKTFASLLRG